MTFQNVIERLNEYANPEKVLFKQKKFGVVAHNSLGVYHSDLKVIAKEIGHNPELALQLIKSNIYEARLLGSKILKPKDVTEKQMQQWVKTFENWEVCDSFCMGLFSKTEFAVRKILEWAERKPEFEKRAAFATLSSYCMADKKAANSVFEQFFPIIIREANDERLYVKKAVNWALRSIGKRNIDLNKKAVIVSQTLSEMESKSAQWIAKDALQEFKKPSLNILDYPRSIYRIS